MKKLLIIRDNNYDNDFDYDRRPQDCFDGYLIVGRKDDEDAYAKVWDRSLALVVKKALERAL